MNALQNLYIREQQKLATNVYRLAGYYCPQGKMPDLLDFSTMNQRVKLLADENITVQQLFPLASDGFRQRLESVARYAIEQQQTVVALEPNADGEGMTLQEQFEHGKSQDQVVQSAKSANVEIGSDNYDVAA